MRARIGLEEVHTGHSRSRPTAADRSLRELHNRPESLSEPEDISNPEDIRGEEAPVPTPAQPQREDAAENSREPIAPPALRVTVQEAARILETGADALLEAKYEVIADLRDGGGSIEEQHHGKCRSQEADVR
jgi:hypothetical protein